MHVMQGMLAAARTAGLEVGALVNATSAAALTYARFHESELTNKPRVLGIIDVGHSTTQVRVIGARWRTCQCMHYHSQVCIAKLQRGSVHVLAHAWDADLGACNFIDIIFDACAREFQSRHKLDVRTNPKASFRLRHECSKALKVLSANKDAQVRVECLLDDLDLASHITRQQLEAAAAPLLQRLLVPMQEAAQLAGLTVEQLDVVELTGGGGRIPAVGAAVQEALGREPGRSLNSKEAAAEGCAWMAARLSGRFKYVRHHHASCILGRLLAPLLLCFLTTTSTGSSCQS